MDPEIVIEGWLKRSPASKPTCRTSSYIGTSSVVCRRSSGRTRAVTAGWQPLTSEDKEDFKTAFAGRLRPDQIDKLVNWYDVEIAPKLGMRRG